MGGLFITTHPDPVQRLRHAETARPHFARAGLTGPITIDIGSLLIEAYPKYRRPTPALVHLKDGDFAIAIGTFLFQGHHSTEALRRYLADPAAKPDDCRGAYLLLINRQRRITLQADAHGTYECYLDHTRTLFSTVFLALAACLPRRTLRPAECLEYVVGGVTLGTGTPLAEIDRLDLGETIDFADTSRRHIVRPRLVEPERPAPIEELIEHSLASLRATMTAYAAAFDKRIRISFSGGYDSRLLFALARDCGVDPELFVYGSAASPDVRHAAALARSEGARFEHIDKLLIRPVTLDLFPEMLNASYEMNDAFSQYWMFCSDSENYARIDRCSGDGVIMNGGGGEVFRNFFKFRGQSMSVRRFIHAFLSSYDPGILRHPGLRAAYDANLSRKITDLFDLARPILDRAHVQSLYPHLRCRSWFGRDTSLDLRFGDRATPYLEPTIARAALQIPLGWKQFGIFQGRLIKALSPSIARHMSSHGYPFDRDPPWRARLGDLRLFAQPLATRRYNAALKQKFARSNERPKELSKTFIESVMNTSCPNMSSMFDISKITEHAQYQRVMILEYMMQKLD